MDRDTIIRLARDAAFHTPVQEGELLRFAALVAALEREACAQIAKQWDKDHPRTNYGGCIALIIEGRK